jgi:NADPH:quinone reductase-like Zn-dependent oxidoreductase
MKAAMQDRYGRPRDVLGIRDVPTPVPGDDDVLVRVRAAGVNPADVFITTGSPAMMRAVAGLRRPRFGARGQDVAGVVEAVGSTVTAFRPGDEVFGEMPMAVGGGTFAELVCAPESVLAPKPERLSFEQAGALPMAGLAALHGLRAGRVGQGTRVLVNGASGGVGHLAVQIAVALGAEVTGVCSARNVEMVRGLGARHVVDYTAEDFTASAGRYDLILDNVANRSLRSLRRVLAPRGVLLMNSGNGGRVLGPLPRMARGYVLALVSRQTIRVFSYTPTTTDLVELKDLADGGELAPVVEGAYPLADVAAALERVAGKHVAGKVVVTV